jgi:hypothetical protein
MKTTRAQHYVKRIKNGSKQLYARTYLAYLERLGQSEALNEVAPIAPDYAKYGLSYMAGQAVRIELRDLIRMENPPITA